MVHRKVYNSQSLAGTLMGWVGVEAEINLTAFHSKDFTWALTSSDMQ